jgi:pimeloyl-ACP methyl ester carboxylesterase
MVDWRLMRPVLIPMAERLGRLALRQRGFATRWVPTPTGVLHAFDAPGRGALPTVVLLHGIGSSSTPFAPVMVRLARHVRRVVAVDYPGHGFSPRSKEPLTPDRLFASVTTALDDLLAGDRAIVVGNSLGGAVALHYARERSRRVRGLVLLSPAGARSTEQEWRALKAAFDLRSRADALGFLDRVYHRTPRIAALIAHELPGSLLRPAVRELLASTTQAHFAAPEALAALDMPVLLLWGRSERLLPRGHLTYFREHLPPHAIVEQPEGVGHCPHVDAPSQLAARIVAFARDAIG